MIAVDRAQTVLRYWNWSLSSAHDPGPGARRSATATKTALDEYSVPQRAAMLALSSRPRALSSEPSAPIVRR